MQGQQNGYFLKVSNPQTRDGGLTKYVVYQVTGQDQDGAIDIFRRFSDFFSLRMTLTDRWPGIYVPPLPPKKAVGNMDNAFIEDRRQKLDRFLNEISQIPHLLSSDEMAIFLRSGQDIEKQLKALPNQSYEDLIQKYQSNFKDLSGKEINTQLLLKIQTFSSFLKQNREMLVNFKDMAKNASEKKAKMNEEIKTFMTFLAPEYEKNILSELAQERSLQNTLFFSNSDNDSVIKELSDSLKQNAYNELLNKIRREIEEVHAFFEAVNTKIRYDQFKEIASNQIKEKTLEIQKINAGKSNLSSMFTGSTKEQQIQSAETSISKLQKESESLQFICDIIVVIMGYVEIDKFKEKKQNEYCKLMKEMAAIEIEQSQRQQRIWSLVAQIMN